MKLYFIRHGESEANILKEFSNHGLKHGLTQKGREQAKSVSDELSNVAFQKLFSSPLLRAIETAEIISKEKDLPYDIANSLIEFDCGELEGKSDDASWNLFETIVEDWLINGNWERRFAGGESFIDIKRRFMLFVEDITQAYGNSTHNICIVSHGGFYFCALPLILKNIDFSFALNNKLKNTSYVVAEYLEKQFVCLKWGDVDFT